MSDGTTDDLKGRAKEAAGKVQNEAGDAPAIHGPERYQRPAGIRKTGGPTNMFRLDHNIAPTA